MFLHILCRNIIPVLRKARRDFRSRNVRWDGLADLATWPALCWRIFPSAILIWLDSILTLMAECQLDKTDVGADSTSCKWFLLPTHWAVPSYCWSYDMPQAMVLRFCALDLLAWWIINLPYRFYLLQRIQDYVEQASESEQKKFVRYFTKSAWLLFWH